MDVLLLYGILILSIVVISPIIALVALSYSRRAREEVTELRKQLEGLQRHPEFGWQEDPKASSSAPPEPELPQTAIAEPEAKSIKKSESLSDISNKSQLLPDIATEPPVSQKESSDPFAGLVRWLLKGNPLAKPGILLLFFGVAYLFKYTIDRNMFSIELRLASAALIGIILLAVGWRLRHKQQLYALILQGGAIGALYITVLAAFRLYWLLPHAFTFGLLLFICAASVGLAVLQRALSLAMLAGIGGYLAPILLAINSGNPIGLFSYYLLVSCGLLAISIRQSWQSLNLPGFFFTFGAAALWGTQHYRPADYLSCQLFLIANLILFSLLTQLFAVKNRVKQHMAIDGTLLFGPPLIGFAMQCSITSHWVFGPAFSALGFGSLYLITWAALRRFPQDGKRIAAGYLASGGIFVTLVIPLALSAQWTALVWALEGAGVLWFGLLQNQQRFSWSGSALLALSLFAQLVAYMGDQWDISAIFVLPVIFLCFITGGALWRHYRPDYIPWQALSLIMLITGIVVWCWWLVKAADYFYWLITYSEQKMLELLGFSISIWIWRKAGQRLNWPALRQTVWLLWPGCGAILQIRLAVGGYPLVSGWWDLIWIAAIASAVLLLLKDAPALLSPWLEKTAHLLWLWLVLILVGSEIFWRINRLSWEMNEWHFYGQLCCLSLTLLALWIMESRRCWPLNRHAPVYWLGCIPLVLTILWHLLYGNIMDGQMVKWRYLPLINPLEQAAIFGLLMLAVWQRHTAPLVVNWVPQFNLLARWLLWGLAAWWLNGMLLRALAYYADIPWRFDMLWASRLIQATFTIVWTSIALILMNYSVRIRLRPLWFAGATALIILIIKLFLIDSAHASGLAWAIAFPGVAILLLVVGYFLPLPPRQKDKQELKE